MFRVWCVALLLSDHVRGFSAGAGLRARSSAPHPLHPLSGPRLSVVDAYLGCLEVAPLATKVVTSGAIAGLGDCISQLQASGARTRQVDAARCGRFALTGLGNGFLWSHYFDVADSLTAGLEGAPRVAISMAIEQFLWCPIVYSLYLIPTSILLNGGALSEVAAEVRQKLPALLVDNAKVWSPANVLIYNVPLQYRAVTSNGFDLIWATVCARMAASCAIDDEECRVEATGILPTRMASSGGLARRVSVLGRRYYRRRVRAPAPVGAALAATPAGSKEDRREAEDALEETSSKPS